MKKNSIYFLLILFFLSFCSCGKNKEDESQANMDGLYLSITETTWDNGTDSSGGMTSTEYIYDLATEETYTAGSAAYTSQYPLAVYDKGDNILYYSADDKNGSGGDELCCKILDTGECYQLTDNLFAINYIIPTRDYIILIAVNFSERNLTPYRYEKSTGELLRIQVYKDFSVRECVYDPVTERLFLGGFLESEDYQKVSDFNDYLFESGQSTEDVEFTPADGYVFELTEEYQVARQILYIKEQGIEKGIAYGEDGKLYLQLSYTSRMAMFGEVTKSWVLDADTGEIESSDYFDKLPIYVSNYTKCGEDYYILGASLEDDDEKYPRAIYRYSPKEEKLEMIYRPEGKGFINQFRVCKDIGKTNLMLKEEWKLPLMENEDASGSDLNLMDTARKQIEEMQVQIPDENGLIETKWIPDRMQPGSCIYFVDDTHFIVLFGGIYYDTEEKVKESQEKWFERIDRAEASGATFLPMSNSEKGMYMDYDSNGYAHRGYDGLTLEEAQEKAKRKAEEF